MNKLISQFQALNLDFKIYVNMFESRRKVAEKAVEAYADMISKLPTVSVITCKECKWYGKPGCAIKIVDESDKPGDSDFCSFGELRGAEDDKEALIK